MEHHIRLTYQTIRLAKSCFFLISGSAIPGHARKGRVSSRPGVRLQTTLPRGRPKSQLARIPNCRRDGRAAACSHALFTSNMSSEGTRAGSGRVLSIPTTLSRLATLELSVPAEHVLLITLNRPKALNVFNEEMEEEMRRVMEWVDEDTRVWYFPHTFYCHRKSV